MKRLCLFAGYNKNGTVADYVVYYIKSLSEFCDVYYLADCEMKAGELGKLAPYIKNAWAYRHKKYDFGSWQELLQKIGRDMIAQYDELILCNDSCFAPLYPLLPLLEKASQDKSCDFWGFTQSESERYYLQSYFLVLRKAAFMSDDFHKFMDAVKEETHKNDIVYKYEKGLTYALADSGLRPARYGHKSMTTHKNWKSMVEDGIPFFKVSNFTFLPFNYHGETLKGWKPYLDARTNYDTTLITSYFEECGIDYKYLDSKLFEEREKTKLRDKIWKWFIHIHFTKRNKILCLFGFYFIKDRECDKISAQSIPRLNKGQAKDAKRLCLFAGYDKMGAIADYVAYYIKSLAEFSEVHYMADCEMKADELAKIAPYVKSASGVHHKKYDFGSWQELINKIGWNKVSEYDELILCNDSCFGPLYPLKPIFEKASADGDCDFWAMTEGWIYADDELGKINLKHLQSYFIVFKKSVFTSEAFQTFINSIEVLDSKDKIVRKYEIALTGLLRKEGFKPKKYVNTPLEPYNNWKTLVEKGMPFIKTRVFIDAYSYKYKETLTDWDGFIQKSCDYDPKMISGYLKDVDFGYFDTMQYKLVDYMRKFKVVRKWILQIRFNKKAKIIRIFGKYLINTKPESIESL